MMSFTGKRAGTASARVRVVVAGPLMACAMLALAACSETIRTHGFVPPADELEAIKVGVDTRDSVAESIGAPNSSGVLEGGNYYYIETQVRHYGAYAPEVINRQVVAISFTQSGVVQNIERFGLENGKPVVLERRVTDSGVQSNGLWRQLIGNVGNFNAASSLNN